MKIISSLIRVVYFLTHHKVPLWLKAIPLLGIAYLIWPRDILMDFSFGIGLIDDLIVLIVLFSLFKKIASTKLNDQRSKKQKVKVVEAKYKVIHQDQREKKK